MKQEVFRQRQGILCAQIEKNRCSNRAWLIVFFSFFRPAGFHSANLRFSYFPVFSGLSQAARGGNNEELGVRN
jgi:hypothetical protein